MFKPITTDRLILRPTSDADFDFIYRIQSDGEMMRYIRAPVSDPEIVRERMAQWSQYAENNPGLGAGVAVWKDSGVPAGTFVVRHVEYQPGNDLEIGYLIVPENWGRGLATEIAGALVDYIFAGFDVPRIVAVVDPENIPSQRVLQKCGFQIRGRRFIYDSDNLELILDRP